MNPLLISGIFDIGKKLIDSFFPDKIKQANERAQAELTLMNLAQEGRLKEMAIQLSAIIAEANSPDPWTSRARPSFLYVMYIMILAALPMGVLFAFKPEVATGVTEGLGLWLAAIPGELYALFGAGYLGYTGFRTVEKAKGVAK